MGLKADLGENWATRRGLDTEHVYEGRDALVAGGKLELSQRFSPLLERAV